MQVTSNQIWLLLPTVVVALLSLVIMLSIVIRRDHRQVYRVSIAGYALFALTVLAGYALPTTDITPLIRSDSLARVMLLITAIAALAICWQSRHFFEDSQARGNDHKVEEYYLLLSLALLGAIVLVQANHIASWILGLELLGLTSCVLAVYPYAGRKAELPHQLEAGIKYLILSGVASAILFFGLALYYLNTGQLAFATLVNNPHPGILFIALLLVFAGMAFKLSLFPFHQWTPDLYQGAALPTATLLASVAKLGAVVVLVRFVHQSHLAHWLELRPLLAPLAILSMIGGNLLALQQQDLRRLLAYSAIAHMGYLLLALQMAGDSRLALSSEAAIFYLVAYVITSLGAFLWLSGLRDLSPSGAVPLSRLRSLFWQRPAYALLLLVLLLSLAGIPLTIGFFGKFYLVNVALSHHLWPELLALLLGSGLGLYYYLRVVLTVCAGPESESDPVPPAESAGAAHDAAADDVAEPTGRWLSPELASYWPAWVMGALVLLWGIFPQLLSRQLPF